MRNSSGEEPITEVVGSTPEQAAAVVNRQLDQWADVIRRTGIKLQ